MAVNWPGDQARLKSLKANRPTCLWQVLLRMGGQAPWITNAIPSSQPGTKGAEGRVAAGQWPGWGCCDPVLRVPRSLLSEGSPAAMRPWENQQRKPHVFEACFLSPEDRLVHSPVNIFKHSILKADFLAVQLRLHASTAGARVQSSVGQVLHAIWCRQQKIGRKQTHDVQCT